MELPGKIYLFSYVSFFDADFAQGTFDTHTA